MNTFPDLPHLFQLQADLWKWPKSRAAIMVGAGLSLNANKIPCASQKFLTWRELTRCMYDELHPITLTNDELGKIKRENHFLSCDSLRLASEYEAEFGRGKLDNLIRSSLPDSEYQPSELHELLLALPWADVFTTNYDTLLERTDILGKSYQTVTKAEDLTRAYQPRIVKLHGSFPNQTPFIITEEDFRTYPHKFSPFVNTVQQSLTENSFVLIGFSGDDPNFKSWTGWIRDNLNNHHAPIYLIGLLNISNAERALLSARGVTPIDLAQIITGKIKGNPHEVALQWFLNFLHSARPPRLEDWPNISKKRIKDLAGTSRIPAIQISSPPKNDSYPTGDFTDDMAAQTIYRWRYERTNYPGWIILRSTKRENIWDETSRMENAIWRLAQNWVYSDKIRFLYELNWRYEISLMPLFSDTADNILTILEQNRESQSSDELKLPLTKKMGSINDQELDEVWMSLALGVLREARETFREDRWNLISAKIDQRFGEALNSHDRYQYEKALWSLRKLSRKMTNAVLNSWNPSPRNPLAKMWKSSILSEIGQLVDARNLLLGALNEIRRSFTIQGRNTELFSLEGWCSFSLANIEANGASDYDSKRISEFHERWDELKAWDCDPRVLGQYFLHELAKPMPEMAPAVSKVTRSFDPGITTYQRSWRSDILVDFMPAFGCLRLFENAGLSMRNAYAGWKDAVIKACKWTAPFNSFGSTVIIACLIDAKKLDEEGFLTRIEVANMTDDDIGKFYDWAFNALRDELSDLQKTDTQKRNSLAVVQALVEILSRISFGLSEDKLNNVFRLAIDYFSNPQIRADSSALKVNHTLFKRVFYAADNSLLENWLMEVMKLPLNPIIDVYQRNRLDPIDVFPDGRCKSSSEIPTESFKKIFEDLLKVAASRNRPQSDDAFKRLFSLSAVGKTTSDQNEVLGREIWREVDDDGLPTIQVYGRSNFLFYPAPFNVDVADIVRKNILNQISKINGAFDTGEVRDMLQSIADSPCVFASTDSRVRPIDWTEKDSEILFEFIENWWKQAKAPLEGYSGDCPMPDDSFNPLTEAIGALSIVLARVIVPKMTWAEEADWDKVYSLSSDVEATGKYIYICLPFILMHRPQDCERVRLIIEENLNSVSEKRVKAGARAVGWWAWGRNIATLPPIPSTLIQSLVDRVCHRESLGLSAVVNILADILNSRAQEINSEIVSALARALISWQRGLFEKLENGDFKFNSDADLSQCCALGELASSIRKWLSHQGLNTADYPGILLWQETCEKNKLPELKRCFADFNSND